MIPTASRCTATLALMLSLLAGPAQAQAQAQAQAPDDTLYQALGGQRGLVRLVDDLGLRLMADARMKPFFKDVNMPELKDKLAVQFCEVSGGPCKRKGPDMKVAHDGFDITKSDFNALVEVLQLSMDAQGIAFGAQTRLLARLAPMHRQIINVP